MFLDQAIVTLKRRQATANDLVDRISAAIDLKLEVDPKGRVRRKAVQDVICEAIGEKYRPKLSWLIKRVLVSKGIEGRILHGKGHYKVRLKGESAP